MNPPTSYRDASLPVEERVRDLLGRMTLEEKAAQTADPFGAAVDVHAPPETGWGAATAALSTLGLLPRDAARAGNELQRKHVEGTRLGIPVLLAEEALVGLKVRDATTFPDAIAQACTWDPDLVEEMARTIGRQMARLGVRQALSPLADVARDPRWGRVEETYGEDPYLVGTMASAFVRGLQEADPNVPVMATLKHFLGYGASDGGRNTGPAQLGPRELREVYALPFEMAIRAGARGVMPAYNAIDGVPVTGSRVFLSDLLRDELGFDGLVTSDLAAVSQLHTKDGTAEDAGEAFAQALRAGVDLDLDNRASSDLLVDGVRSGALAEADLDRAVAGVLRAKFRLGLFERPYVDVEAVPETLDSTEERALARRIAERSIVLLQNEPVAGRPLLPLEPGPKTIAVIGPNADRPLGQLGNYSYQVLDSVTRRFSLAADPQARPEDVAGHLGAMQADDARLLVESVPVVTFVEGIRRRLGAGATVVHELGCPVAALDRSGFSDAVRAATGADVAVLVVGDQSGINGFGTVGEGLDSAGLELPGMQRELVEAVVGTGTPTVVVLSHGRPYVLGWLADLVPAIVTGFFGGEEAGSAVAAVLFGDVNPAGRLPMAFLRSAGAAPSPYWRTPSGRPYVDGSSGPTFPFGHGLSYTQFEYRDLEIESAEVPTDGAIRLSFTVANVGARAGDEVVQVYGHDVIARTASRGRRLVAFRRLHLGPAAAARVRVDVPTSMVALWDPDEGWLVEPGLVKLFVGASSKAIRLRGEVRLTGEVHHAGADRLLASPVQVESTDFSSTAPPVAAAAAPVSAKSTVREWLDHPVGGALLRAAVGGPAFADDSLAPALDLTMEELVRFSGGRIPQSMLDDLVAKTFAMTHAFPDGFLWGAATAAHQIEGNNLNNDWWKLEHDAARYGVQFSGDAVDSYHRYEEDMRLLADAGCNAYRFSIEWARIEPSPGRFSRAELAHYRRMIDTATSLGLTPVVTLHHFTHPLWFGQAGAWLGPDAVDRFVAYVEQACTILDGVEWVCTINEPNFLAVNHGALRRVAAGEDYPFGALPDGEIGQVLVAAHRAVAPLVRAATGARVGWAVANQALVPAHGAEAKHAEVQRQFEDVYLEPARDDDFVGVQSYTSQLVDEDGVVAHPEDPDNTLMGWAYRPDALGIAVRHTHEVVGDVPIMVTENGIATADDARRITYTADALGHVLDAIDDGIDVRGYLHWSLLDNFEWGRWEPTFGLVAVDRTTFERQPKPSLAWLGRVARANAL